MKLTICRHEAIITGAGPIEALRARQARSGSELFRDACRGPIESIAPQVEPHAFKIQLEPRKNASHV